MFYSLTGKVVFADASSIAVDCHGVAYRCYATLNTLKRTAQTGATITLYTYLAVREDAMELYGFADTEELDFFKLLIGVSGVGPKAALAILSELTPSQLSMSIASGDVKSITRANGVGPKIAQRVVLELKDKIAKNIPSGVSSAQLESIANTAQQGSASAEAVSALVALGYGQTEAARAVARLDISLTVQDLTALAKEGLTSRSKIWDMHRTVEYYRDGFDRYSRRYEDLRDKYESLTEKCRPFLDAMEHFPELVTAFVNKLGELFRDKEAQAQAEKERQIAEREKLRAARKLARKDRDLER